MDISNNLRNPVPSILPSLVDLGTQLALSYNRKNISNADYGTLTAAQKNNKPFIVGFIPPEDQVNFIPFDRVSSESYEISAPPDPPLDSLVGNPSTTDAPTAIPNLAYPAVSLPPGKVQRQRVPVKAEELRIAVANSLERITGKPPTEIEIALVYSHVQAENGGSPSGNMNVLNYNLGNVHAGNGGKYIPGPNGVWKGRKKDGKSIPGNTGSPQPPEDWIDPSTPITGNGKFYVSSDATGDGTWYPVAFKAYDSLQDATDNHISLLARRYPDSVRASTSEEYAAGLLNGVGGRHYHETKPEVYLASIKRNLVHYQNLFPEPLNGQTVQNTGSIIPTDNPDTIQNDDNKKPSITGSQAAVMAAGSFSGLEEDPIGDRMGRGLVVSESRRAIVEEQTSYLREQIEIINKIPPLMLIVNPSEFDKQFQSTLDSAKTRHRNVIHQWIEKPLEISASGVTAGQYIIAADGSGGLTTENRVYSLSYQNLLSLVGIYKNNGTVFSNSGRTGTNDGVPIITFSVYIYYDSHVYIGSFDSFSVNDDASKSHNMSYSFKFTCRYHEFIGDKMNISDSSISTEAAGGVNVFNRTVF